MREETKRWMGHSREDLDAAKRNLSQKVYYVAAFLAQQAAEKALKAYIIEKKEKNKKVHDIVSLAREASVPDELFLHAKQLTGAYVATRYPDSDIPMSRKDFDESLVRELISGAEEILSWVEKNI